MKRAPTPSAESSFKGNKQSLPSKPCVTCGRPMSWRKRWARTWEQVKYCSEACRRQGGATATSASGERG